MNLQLEKIQRTLFKQQQQKLEQDKKKYPAIYGQIKNITDFFYLNDISNKTSNNQVLNSPNKIEYDINSFCESEKNPDLYTPLGKISGDNYVLTHILVNNNINNHANKENLKNINNKNKSSNKFNTNNKKIKEKEDIDFDKNKNKNGNEESMDEDEEENYKVLKPFRYFDDEYDIPEIKVNSKNELIIPIKKNKTNNHKSKSPFLKKIKRSGSRYNTSLINSHNFCYICLSLNHSTKQECPRYKRCHRCFKYGHTVKTCKEKNLTICENCGVASHKKEECLKNPEVIKVRDILLNKKAKLSCVFCGKNNHLVCPYSTREKFIIISDKGNMNQNGGKKDYSNILFCPLCGENHLKEECPSYKSSESNSLEEKSKSNKDNNKIKENKENKEDKNIKENDSNKKNKGEKEIENIKDKNSFISKKRSSSRSLLFLNNFIKRKTSTLSWATDDNEDNNNNLNDNNKANNSNYNSNFNYDNNNNNQKISFEINWSSNNKNYNNNNNRNYNDNNYNRNYNNNKGNYDNNNIRTYYDNKGNYDNNYNNRSYNNKGNYDNNYNRSYNNKGNYDNNNRSYNNKGNYDNNYNKNNISNKDNYSKKIYNNKSPFNNNNNFNNNRNRYDRNRIGNNRYNKYDNYKKNDYYKNNDKWNNNTSRRKEIKNSANSRNISLDEEKRKDFGTKDIYYSNNKNYNYNNKNYDNKQRFEKNNRRNYNNNYDKFNKNSNNFIGSKYKQYKNYKDRKNG